MAESKKTGQTSPKAGKTSPEAAMAKLSKSVASGKALRVTQIGSPIGREDWQKQTLIGLGLNKLNRSRVLQDTPAVRGMIMRVHHLVKVEEAA